MTQSAIGPVQQAFYDRMMGSSELTEAADVYDEVPENAKYPYVVFTSFTAGSWRTHSGPGEEVTVTLNILSQYAGYAEGQAILTILNKLFGDSMLDVEGYKTIRCYYDFSTVFRTPNNTRTLSVRYRLQLLENR